MKDYRLEPPDPIEVPECPCCGSIIYSYIYDGYDGIAGCSECISGMTAEEWWEELAEEREPDPDLAYEEMRDREWEREHDGRN